MCFLSQKLLAKVIVKKISFTQQNVLEISLSQKSNFKIFILKNPDRMVVDIADCDLEKPLSAVMLPAFISALREGNNDNFLRIVFDLKQKVALQKIKFNKFKNSNAGKISAEIIMLNNSANLLTVEQKKPDFIVSKVEEFDFQTQTVNNADGSKKYVVKKIPKNLNQKNLIQGDMTFALKVTSLSGRQNFDRETNPVTKNLNSKNLNLVLLKKIPVIVIDPGHGGKDPGTIGNFARTKEKNLTLSYAKELGKYLINTKRYKVYLTRDSDTFIALRKRVEIARKKKADLFISLHANSTANSEITGFSIYTLSKKSSDHQAELLAQKENQADIIKGVDFSGTSQDIMKTLIDLSQRQSMNGSSHFAGIAIKSVKNSEINILQNTHRFAGFAVLTAPDMISVLIELGYLSNKNEEKLLNSISYKRKVAQSLVKAIDEYFAKNKS
jgi:N-acetylmuramoyl-L-alanine amidase